MTEEGILVVGHGSKLDYSKEAVSYCADRLADRFDPVPVRVGFMNINEPRIVDSLDELVSSGARTIYVVPAFLAHGIHTTKDITRVLGIPEGKREATVPINGSEVNLRYCEPIGCDDRVADILEERVRAKMQ
jgi:sirohydrochlorin cobaltochelatase